MLAVVWGFSVVADSVQFSTMVSETGICREEEALFCGADRRGLSAWSLSTVSPAMGVMAQPMGIRMIG